MFSAYQTTTRNYKPFVEFLLSNSLGKGEAKWLGFHLSILSHCCSTAPNPMRLPSQVIRVSAVQFMFVTSATSLMPSLISEKALSCSSHQYHLFAFFRKGLNGKQCWNKVGIYRFIWLTAPKIERNSFWSFWFQAISIAPNFTIYWFNTRLGRWNPNYPASFSANSHLPKFGRIFIASNVSKTLLNFGQVSASVPLASHY